MYTYENAYSKYLILLKSFEFFKLRLWLGI